jgi:protein O-mannosyl-transferase
MRLPPWLLAALVGFCLYAPTLRGTYIFDDLVFVRDDPRIASVSQWGKFWTQAYYPTSQDRLYRPLTSMTYAVEWWLFGDRPWIFHLINVLIYAADCAAIAELARRLGGKPVGYFAGLLFAIHPVHVEAVAYLVGRAELLSTGTMLWAMILALGELKPTRIIAITVLLIVGLFCKEQAILLPIFIGGFFLLQSPGCTSEVTNRRKILILVLCWTDAAYLICREYSPMKLSWDPGLLDWTMQPLIRAVGINRWLIPFSVLGRYTLLMFAPYKQALDYGYAVTNFVQRWNDPFLWLGFGAAFMGIVAIVIALHKRAWLVVWCLIGIALSYGIISNFAGLIGTIMGERLMFLPSVFCMILLAYALLKLPRQGAFPILILCLFLGSLRTELYANQWTDRLQFYERQAADNPHNERTWWLLAEELDRSGHYDDAMTADEHMRLIDPNYWIAWYYAGHIAMDAGKYDPALKYLDRAWKCVPAGNLEINLLRDEIRHKRGLHNAEYRHNVPSTNS